MRPNRHLALGTATLALAFLVIATPAFSTAPALYRVTGDTAADAFSSAATVDARRVIINPDVLASGAERLDLELLDGTVLAIHRDGLEHRGPGDMAWRGRSSGADGSRVTLTLRNGFVVGTIYGPNGVYALKTLQDGGQALAKIDQELFPPCEGGLEPPDLPAQPRPTSIEPTRARGETVGIDLMSLYSPQTRDAAGGVSQIEAEIQAGVDEANTAFIDSDMVARFTLVHTALTDRDDSGSIGTDLSWLANNAGVAALRNAVHADMVSLIANSGGCGIAFVMRNPGAGFASSAFQVSGRGCLTGNLTFAHEHGHNMGFEHDPANGGSPGSASYPWSFGHFVDGVYRTVMSYSNQCTLGCTRMPHFSNPDISHLGFPTGLADTRDNHRSGNLTAAIVRDFRTPPPPIFIDGFESGDTTSWSSSTGS